MPGFGCIDCPHKKLNQPLNISTYPNIDTGFRIVTKKGVRTKINYTSFCDYLREQHFIQGEKDGTIYQKKNGFWQDISTKMLLSKYKKYIQPDCSPTELGDIPKYIRNHNVFDLEIEQRRLKDILIFKNCALNIRTKKLVELPETVKNTYILNFDYNPVEKAPYFEKMVDFIFGSDYESKDYFFKYMSAALFTNDKFHKALILCGDGSNGKSSLMYAISNLFPEESGFFTNIDLSLMTKDQIMKSTLRLARIGYCSDESAYVFKKYTNLLKRIISGETFTYRLHYQNNMINFNPRAKIVIGLNTLPQIGEGTFGMRRRFSIVDFHNTIQEKDYDKDHYKKLNAEKSGIFNYLLEYYERYRYDKKLLEFKQQSYDDAVYLGDIKEAFWKDCVEIIKKEDNITLYDMGIKTSEVWNAFKKYTEQEGEKYVKIKRRALTQWILIKKVRNSQILFDKQVGGVVRIHGIKLKNLEDFNEGAIGALAGNSTSPF